MGKEAFLKPGEKHKRKLKTLGGMKCHECNAGFGIELVRVGSQSRVVKEFRKSFAACFGVVRGVGQLLEIFNAAEGFRRSFGFKSLDVAGAVDDETN